MERLILSGQSWDEKPRLGPQPRAIKPHPRLSLQGDSYKQILAKTRTRLYCKRSSRRPRCKGFPPPCPVSSRPCPHVGCSVQCPARAWPLTASLGPNPSSATELLGRLTSGRLPHLQKGHKHTSYLTGQLQRWHDDTGKAVTAHPQLHPEQEEGRGAALSSLLLQEAAQGKAPRGPGQSCLSHRAKRDNPRIHVKGLLEG